MTRARLSAALGAALVATLAAGCRNPFDPKADIRFARFFTSIDFGYILTISQNDANNLSTPANAGRIMVIIQLDNFSTVSATYTGYSVVYRQLFDNQPIADCGGAAGRRFKTLMRVPALQNNTSVPFQDSYDLPIVTTELLTYIANTTSLQSGGIDCEITLYGEDENGHDIRTEAVLHIDVF